MAKEPAQSNTIPKITFFEQNDYTVAVTSSNGDEYHLFADTPRRLYVKRIESQILTGE